LALGDRSWLPLKNDLPATKAGLFLGLAFELAKVEKSSIEEQVVISDAKRPVECADEGRNPRYAQVTVSWPAPTGRSLRI
jgi:hypothetical protein